MGPNESWQSEVEQQLRSLKDYSINQSINQLASQGQLNYVLPSRGQEMQPQSQDAFSDSELIWIRMTSTLTVNGQIYYAWRRQIKLATAQGFIWVDSGESGSLDYMPATGVNNENVSVTDGKRYPAKWNPGTSQWIFFLRNHVPPPSGGSHYGVKTWVVWKDRSSIPALAAPLADDLEHARVISGGLLTYPSRVSDHGKVCAYSAIQYVEYNVFRVADITYVTPGGTARNIPGIGAYDSETGKSRFLHADSSISSNTYGVGTNLQYLSPGSLVISDVNFHYDDSHGTNVIQNVAVGDIHFEWPYLPSGSIEMRMSDDSVFPGVAVWPYTLAQTQAAWEGLKSWKTASYGIAPFTTAYSSGDAGGGVVLELLDLAPSLTGLIHSFLAAPGSGLPSASIRLGMNFRDISEWTVLGDYFVGGPVGSGYIKYRLKGSGSYNYDYLRIGQQYFLDGFGVEIQW